MKCALCKKTVKKPVFSRAHSIIGRRKAFHEKCLEQLDEMYVEERHVMGVVVWLVVGLISLVLAYIMRLQKNLGLGGESWLYLALIGVLSLLVSSYNWMEGPLEY